MPSRRWRPPVVVDAPRSCTGPDPVCDTLSPAQTLSALSLGATTLRSVLSSPTLQLSNISATTSALDDALISASEVSDAVDAIGAGQLGAEGEDEVEAELRGLQEEEERKERTEEDRRERERVREVEQKLGKARVPVEGKQDGKVPGGKDQAETGEVRKEALPA